MWSKVKRLLALGVALGGLTPCIALAGSSPEQDEEAKRWSFAIAVTSGFDVQDHHGDITPSADIISLPPIGTGPSGQPEGIQNPAPLRPPTSSSASTLNPYFGANLEVMAPEIEWIPGKPRFFANVDLAASFASTSVVAIEGTATEFNFPDTDSAVEDWPQQAITGLGSRLESTLSGGMYSIQVGAAFPSTIRGRLVRWKPTVGWLNYGVEAEGRLLSAYKDDPDPPRLAAPFYGKNVRLIELEGSGSRRYNALGPGMEIELELDKWRWFRPSVYLVGNAFKILDNDPVEFEDTVSVDDALGEADYSTTWQLTPQDWIFRAGLGIRFRWVGGS